MAGGGTQRKGRRKPLLLGLLAVGIGGGIVIFALQSRPDAGGTDAVQLPDAYVGTDYAFDGTLCLDSPVVDAEVLSIEIEQAAGSTTRVLVPSKDARVTLAFPVQDDSGEVPEGYVVPAGETNCTLRVLVTPQEQGTVEAGTVRVRLGYGPFGLLRRTAEVQPQVLLEVTGTGTDPRTEVS